MLTVIAIGFGLWPFVLVNYSISEYVYDISIFFNICVAEILN